MRTAQGGKRAEHEHVTRGLYVYGAMREAAVHEGHGCAGLCVHGGSEWQHVLRQENCLLVSCWADTGHGGSVVKA